MPSVPARVFGYKQQKLTFANLHTKKVFIGKLSLLRNLAGSLHSRVRNGQDLEDLGSKNHRRSPITGMAGSEPFYKQRPKSRTRETLFPAGSDLARLRPELRFSVPILLFNGTQPVQRGTYLAEAPLEHLAFTEDTLKAAAKSYQ